jgi:hypothetical protein
MLKCCYLSRFTRASLLVGSLASAAAACSDEDTHAHEESADLLAFLRSLTDETFIHDKRLSDPFAPVPER